MADLRQKAGATPGKDMRDENLTKYFMAEASDGYQVIFALAKLDKGFCDLVIILAMLVAGKALPAGDGPFRMIVQDEKKPARCIKQVTAKKILFAKSLWLSWIEFPVSLSTEELRRNIAP